MVDHEVPTSFLGSLQHMVLSGRQALAAEDRRRRLRTQFQTKTGMLGNREAFREEGLSWQALLSR